jgi:hypothetical protein
MDESIIEFNVYVRKLACSDLRLQLLKTSKISSTVTRLLKFEKTYHQLLQEPVVKLGKQIETSEEIALEIFRRETSRRLKMYKKHMNFSCPDCVNLIEEDDSFTCSKGIYPAKVLECPEFTREGVVTWAQHVNNQKEKAEILEKVLEENSYLFDFKLLSSASSDA